MTLETGKIREISNQISQAVYEIGVTHGVVITLKDFVWNGDSFNAEIVGNSFPNLDEIIFTMHKKHLGIKFPLGFSWPYRGGICTVVGIDVANKKYPVLVENEKGDRHTYSVGIINEVYSSAQGG